jgi:hypothetical protein
MHCRQDLPPMHGGDLDSGLDPSITKEESKYLAFLLLKFSPFCVTACPFLMNLFCQSP